MNILPPALVNLAASTPAMAVSAQVAFLGLPLYGQIVVGTVAALALSATVFAAAKLIGFIGNGMWNLGSKGFTIAKSGTTSVLDAVKSGYNSFMGLFAPKMTIEVAMKPLFDGIVDAVAGQEEVAGQKEALDQEGKVIHAAVDASPAVDAITAVDEVNVLATLKQGKALSFIVANHEAATASALEKALEFHPPLPQDGAVMSEETVLRRISKVS